MQFTIQFRNCLIVGDTEDRNAVQLGYAPGWADTRFPDGTHTDARPHNTPEVALVAARAGYGTDPRSLGVYCCEHEIAHTFVAEARGQPYSPTLYTQAHRADHTYTREEIDELIIPEERVVKAWQRYVNTGQFAAGLGPLVESGADLAALKARWEHLIAEAFGRAYWWRGPIFTGPTPWGPGPPPDGIQG